MNAGRNRQEQARKTLFLKICSTAKWCRCTIPVLLPHKPFEGGYQQFERRFMETDSPGDPDEFSQYQSAAMCEHCQGKRLKPEALEDQDRRRDIMDVSAMSHQTGARMVWASEEQLSPQKAGNSPRQNSQRHYRPAQLFEQCRAGISVPVPAIRGTPVRRRSAANRLASQIGSGLTGVMRA